MNLEASKRLSLALPTASGRRARYRGRMPRTSVRLPSAKFLHEPRGTQTHGPSLPVYGVGLGRNVRRFFPVRPRQGSRYRPLGWAEPFVEILRARVRSPATSRRPTFGPVCRVSAPAQAHLSVPSDWPERSCRRAPHICARPEAGYRPSPPRRRSSKTDQAIQA